MRVFISALTVFAALNGAAAAQPEPPPTPGPKARDAAACLDTSDPAICLMRLSIRYQPADEHAYELMFLYRPELAGLLGLSPEGIDLSRPAPTGKPESLRYYDDVAKARFTSLQRARSGAPPDRVLSPVMSLPPDGSSDAHRARTASLENLFDEVLQSDVIPRKPELLSAILSAWEREARLEGDFIGLFSENLTHAYLAVGDHAAAERLYRESWRTPRGSPPDREASVLIASHQWAAARSVIDGAPPSAEIAMAKVSLANAMARAGHPDAPAYSAEVLAGSDYGGDDPLPHLRLLEWLLKNGTPDQIRSAVRRWDDAPPAAEASNGFLSLLLFKAYRTLDDDARAERLLTAWRRPVEPAEGFEEAQREEVFGRMLLADRRRAEVLARGWTLERVVAGELLDQQAISDLDAWLAGLSVEDRRTVLRACKDAGLAIGPIAQVTACARRMSEDPTTPYDEAMSFAVDALNEAGDVDPALQRIEDLWRAEPDAEASPGLLWMIGAAILQATGRLGRD